jgi:Spy/CpxP family protein refolding chaperone
MQKWKWMVLPMSLLLVSSLNAGEGEHAKAHKKEHMEKKKETKAQHKKHPGDLQRILKVLNSKLDLNKEQKQEIHKLAKEYRDVLKEKRKALIKKYKGLPPIRLDASKFMSKEKFYSKAFEELIQERWKRQDERLREWRNIQLKALTDTVEKIFKVLTPEQRQKWIELSQKKK